MLYVPGKLGSHSRLEGFTEAVQNIFDLAGIRTNLIEDATILRLVHAGGPAVGRRAAAEAISRRAALHCRGTMGRRGFAKELSWVVGGETIDDRGVWRARGGRGERGARWRDNRAFDARVAQSDVARGLTRRIGIFFDFRRFRSQPGRPGTRDTD